MPKPITVKAVVEYAAQLRREAERETTQDPFASPYRPTEAAARGMSNRVGPEEAVLYLRRRAAMHKRDARQHADVAAASLNKHKNRHRHIQEKRDKQRQHLSPGSRIDGAIARLSMVASTAAAQIGQSVHGGTPDHRPAFSVDAADKARRVALSAVREIEALEDELKVRDLDKAAP